MKKRELSGELVHLHQILKFFNLINFWVKKSQRTLFSMECKNRKSIKQHSNFKSEEEIILMPGFYFQVMSQVNPVEELKIIHLKEINSQFSPIKSLLFAKIIYFLKKFILFLIDR
jgi:hypothetical protein